MCWVTNTYYPRFGFIPDTAREGFLPPYPMPDEYAEYGMYQPLVAEDMVAEKGTVQCADTLNQPQHWRDDESDR